MSLFRIYAEYECGEDGYPYAWHRLAGNSNLTAAHVQLLAGNPEFGIKDIVRAEAENRCVRCGHPYEKGMGQWSPCDEKCRHGGPVRIWTKSDVREDHWTVYEDGLLRLVANPTEAQWRILTVHHLNEVKADCRWWNLAALCQRCHLTIQGKVKMDRPYDKPHTTWFVPYVAGFYAAKYLGEEITREEAEARAEELLALELRQVPLFGRGEW